MGIRRVALVNWTDRQVGGVETYLGRVSTELAARGVAVALAFERSAPAGRPAFDLPPGAPAWCLGEGEGAAHRSLRAWAPDMLYVHGLEDPAREQRLLELGLPAVFFAHSYYGTCISGSKAFTWPWPTPCTRRLGWGCLPRYYARRSGGWSPVTMLRDFDRQRRRLELLPRYRALITHSVHMREEYLRHGLAAERVRSLPYGVVTHEPPRDLRPTTGPPWRLAFVGRLDPLKGVDVLLRALRTISGRVGPVVLTIAGDGPERTTLMRLAHQVESETSVVHFRGWLGRAEVDQLYRDSDLLVVPSLWPEPFGAVGPEAGSFGVPAVAFGVGGIPDWLHDGVNGRLVREHGDATALAEAVAWCLSDAQRLQRLRSGAAAEASRFTIKAHGEALLALLAELHRE